MPNLTDTQMQSIASRINDLVGELKSAGIVAEQSRFNHLFGRNTARLMKIDFIKVPGDVLIEVSEITTGKCIEFKHLQVQSVSSVVARIQHIIDESNPAVIYFTPKGVGDVIMDKINVSGCITVPVRHLLFPTYEPAGEGEQDE